LQYSSIAKATRFYQAL